MMIGIGAGQADTNLFSDVDSSWKTFNEIQTLISKTNGKVVGDLITPVPAVREATSLEDAVRLLLETRYRRLPVVDGDSKLELILIAETTEKWSDWSEIEFSYSHIIIVF